MARLTILLLSYNRPAWLRRAIDSVVAQTFEDWELLVLDDASENQKVLEVLEAAEAGDERIHGFIGQSYTPAQKERHVCTAGRLFNIGLKKTSGPYVTYMTDSAEYRPGRCERLMDHLGRHARLQACWDHIGTCRYDASGNVEDRREPEDRPEKLERWKGPEFERQLSQGNFIDTSSVMERRNNVPWSENPRHWPDMDWQRWKEMAARGYAFHFLPVWGETKHTWDGNVGHVLAVGGTISDAADMSREPPLVM